MSLYFQRGLVFLYALLIINFFLLLLVLSGVYISVPAGGIIITAWLLCCYFSGYFFRHPGRRPVREEEERLMGCLEEVLQRAEGSFVVRLRIRDSEEPGVVAAGHHTMVFSGTALKDCNDEELKGLMAQALGHLRCKDGLVDSAMVTAAQLPLLVRSVFFRAGAILLRVFRLSWLIATGISILFGFVLLMGLYYFMQGKALLLPLLSGIVFVFLSVILDRLFIFFYRIAVRRSEYRQDAYAHRLGYGSGLYGALQKAAAAGGSPTIYDRIRRLEALDRRARDGRVRDG